MKIYSVVLFMLAFAFVFVVAYPAEYEDDTGAARQQRQAEDGDEDHDDVVDFGAHTGDHGAFGWYADFPVHAHAD